MLGTLKFTTQLYTHLSPEIEMLVRDFIAQSNKVKKSVSKDGYNTFFEIDHPDFTVENGTYMLYLGNRLNPMTKNMEGKILHLDVIEPGGKLKPVKYY